MKSCAVRATVSGLVLTVTVGIGGVGRAAGAGPTTGPAAAAAAAGSLEQRNADLQRRLDDMQRQIDAIKHDAATVPPPPAAATLTPATPATATAAPTAAAPAAVAAPATFQSVFLDNRPVVLPGDVRAGWDYKDGFYVQQGDPVNDQFKVSVSGVFDVRYSYTDVRNKTDLAIPQLGATREGALSGFSLYNGQVTIGGELFHHDDSRAFFKATGNFGTLQAPAGALGGEFVLNELYGGYQFSDAVKVRVGAMIVPFTPFLGLTLNGGLTLPNIANEVPAFLPGFGLGADVGGSLFDNRVSYDLMVNNGSISQGITNSTSVLGGSDNRIGAYTREQVCLLGKLGDFDDESDVQDHQNLVAILGGGFGYESQNSSANAFPGPQTTLKIPGLSSATGEGFRPAYTVNGDVLRYVVDLRAKYRGFSFVGEGQYQSIINEADASFIPGYPRHSIGQTGFTAQAAHFILPKHLEIAGRAGQLYTNGLHHEMTEFTFGVNYYLFGENLKFQLAETYVPNQAALTSNTGLVQNTQDWLTQAQLQFKF